MADKEEIRDRSDIVEVIGAHVPLKHKGRNWVGLCPFHQEKTPSFNVDPVTKTFRCWGCGVSGDVFTFIERYENMSFVEAAEMLARRVGLELDRKGAPADRIEKSEREQLYEANMVALEFFRQMLERVPVARDYVYDKRGMAHDTLQRFRIGYAPESWDSLTGHLERNRVDLRLAAKAGLLHPGKTGGFYDVFRHRIVFPIHDEQERIVGFGGRAFGDEQPKYLNTGETPIFAKSKLLYGLPFARKKIGTEGRTLLMEGYMDVIAAHQAGFTNAVATLGTSLTDEHAKKLSRLADTVVLVYDADNAGIKATLRASEILEAQGVNVRVVRLPAGDDPDSLLKRGEIARFQQAIDNAANRVEYQLERIIVTADQESDEGRALMLKRIVHILASVSSRTERDAFMEMVARYHPLAKRDLGLAIESLHRDAESLRGRQRGGKQEPAQQGQDAPQPEARQPRYRPDRPMRGDGEEFGQGQRRKRFEDREERRRPIEPPPPVKEYVTSEERAEREVMRALAEPEWRAAVLKRIAEDDLITDVGRRFFAFVARNQEQIGDDEGALIRLLDTAEDADFSMAVKRQLQEFHAFMANEPLSAAVLDECARNLRKYRVKRVTDELARLLQSKSKLTDEDRRQVEELHRIVRELKGTPEAP